MPDRATIILVFACLLYVVLVYGFGWDKMNSVLIFMGNLVGWLLSEVSRLSKRCTKLEKD